MRLLSATIQAKRQLDMIRVGFMYYSPTFLANYDVHRAGDDRSMNATVMKFFIIILGTVYRVIDESECWRIFLSVDCLESRLSLGGPAIIG